MFVPVVAVFLGYLFVSDHKKVLRILIFRGIGEVERAREHRYAVDDHQNRCQAPKRDRWAGPILNGTGSENG